MARQRTAVEALGGWISVDLDTDTGSVELTVSTGQPPAAAITLSVGEAATMKGALRDTGKFLTQSDGDERADPVVTDPGRGVLVTTVRNRKRRDGYVSLQVTAGDTVRVVTLASQAIRGLVAALGPASRAKSD